MTRKTIITLACSLSALSPALAAAQFLPAAPRSTAGDPEARLSRLAAASTPTDEDRSRPNRKRHDIVKDDPYLRAAFGLADPR